MRLLALLACAVVLSACTSTDLSTPARRTVASSNVGGKYVSGSCLVYGVNIEPILKSVGCRDVHPIIYRAANAGGAGNHLVVAYSDNQGSWLCDNELPWPTKVHGVSDQEKVSEYILRRYGMSDTTTAQVLP